MAKRRTGGGSGPGARQNNRQDIEPPWLEWLEHRPVGTFGAGVVVAGWIVVALLYFRGVWSLEVTFFIAVGLLTFVLGCLAVYAAVMEARRPSQAAVLMLPESWNDFEEYFRWLTPVAFMFGLIFAHFFLH